MGLPNPSVLVRRQTEAVNTQFNARKNEIMLKIEGGVEAQLGNIKAQEQQQYAAIDGKIAEMESIRDSMDPMDPRKEEVSKQIGLLREQKKQVKGQVKLAIASVRANAAREKENIRTRIDREKSKALRAAVEQALAQFSMLIAQRKAQQEGGAADELKSGNRG